MPLVNGVHEIIEEFEDKGKGEATHEDLLAELKSAMKSKGKSERPKSVRFFQPSPHMAVEDVPITSHYVPPEEFSQMPNPRIAEHDERLDKHAQTIDAHSNFMADQADVLEHHHMSLTKHEELLKKLDGLTTKQGEALTKKQKSRLLSKTAVISLFAMSGGAVVTSTLAANANSNQLKSQAETINKQSEQINRLRAAQQATPNYVSGPGVVEAGVPATGQGAGTGGGLV